ncbi:hypothetical protein [Polaribacter sp. SA4-12]|uniref:hypothetical protein n=1 Tax=Polaribacter sp. SA4-12 TaxID=1312072 RepID=UPI000B3D14D7|nr:hypothetical protein [Polaribacter sp. SA4-12]ARV14665.1 hypothetical protein BTO07_05640 [Polaribacter sp. SA4-12]
MDIGFLMKFGSEKNMNDLLKNGTIYCNPLSYFQKLDKDGFIADKLEGTISIKNFSEEKNHILTINPKSKKPIKMKIKTAQMRGFYNNLEGNVYCLYALRYSNIINEKRYKIDERMMNDDYTHCVLIEKVGEFLKRIQNELKKQNVSFNWDLVKYHDFGIDKSEMTLFHKSKNFEFQKEFRILLKTSKLEPFSIKIGDISDIASLYDSKIIKDIKIDII